MRKSANILGQDLGLTAQETNILLKEEGFLEGEPGAYAVTEKGAKYADEQDHHRGTGGSSLYNRYWTTRSWDPSITNELDVTAERKREIRQKAADARRASREPAAEDASGLAPTDDIDREGISLRPIVLVGGGVVAAFGIYKAAPHIKRFVKEKVVPRLRRARTEVNMPGALNQDPDDNSLS
ncbi:hypothetical protein ACWZJV_05370 [Nocardioides sp. WG-D5]